MKSMPAYYVIMLNIIEEDLQQKQGKMVQLVSLRTLDGLNRLQQTAKGS